ncbi:hypothetical protein SA2016_2458 [Sinomonas atrocyanea]|uniref:DUF1684 domain-containing protein n=1 Tax=Sinomonas atrocyanea TaxID=37927 RepID=A0A127A1S1_9MICC|nr:DUF1684 domain-containing protein [Sinomonas atrocyanea]AMM33127.1 hypothetical protein SA2016_2458 [Sinomonas atrocyanea]GEB65859.1 hypothetical protein SAT01_33070 [Sinomonas atrocyanea]GGG73159.1 hypothetical protein GCM10007172_27120 [Sinomonas atrocyanea]
MPDEQHPAESQDPADAWPGDARPAAAPLATAPLPHEVADWRLRVFSLYERVRAAPTPREGHELWRRGRDALFAAHPASPLPPRDRARFRGLPVAPYDPAYRFDVPLTDEGAGQERRVATGTDGVVVFVRLGTFELPGLGRLAAWEHAGYGGGIFVPFRDGTAGRPGPGGSYGAGRYLLDSIKGAFLGTRSDAAGVRYILDFNFAYNPSCAYDEAWACPLPGPENRLSVDVSAGELAPPGA